jgi:hypothetical protein
VAVALRSGVAPGYWLEDARALMTAVLLYDEADKRRR